MKTTEVLGDVLLRQPEGHADALAVRFGERDFSYGKLQRRTCGWPGWG
jgi:non-ribosomal peptide synthetase component E (peptide arylation enzyme)